jgi:hypothetical protein
VAIGKLIRQPLHGRFGRLLASVSASLPRLSQLSFLLRRFTVWHFACLCLASPAPWPLPLTFQQFKLQPSVPHLLFHCHKQCVSLLLPLFFHIFDFFSFLGLFFTRFVCFLDAVTLPLPLPLPAFACKFATPATTTVPPCYTPFLPFVSSF